MDIRAGDRVKQYKTKKRWSWVSVIVVILMVAVVALSGYVTKRTQDNLDSLAIQSVKDTAKLVVQHVENYFDAVVLYDGIAVQKWHYEKVFEEQALANEELSRRLVNHFPYIVSLQYGDQNGNFVMYRKDGEGNVNTKLVLTDSERPQSEQKPRTIWRYYTQDIQVKTVEVDTIDYDPRTRPWYLGAMAIDGLYMTEPYEFFTGKAIGITAARRLLNQGEVAGVYSFDISLDEVIKYINTLEVIDKGETYLVTAEKQVLGVLTEPVSQRLYSGFVNPLSSEDLQLLSEDNLGKVQQRRYGKSGETYFVVYEKILQKYAEPWYVGIRIKRDTVVSAYTSNVLLNALLSFALVVLTAMLLILRSRQRVIHENLEALATRDQLTGLFNRYSFDEISTLLKQRYQETGERFSVILGDIDDFKLINDTYGHHTGDSVLVNLSQVIERNIRDSDYACRWGGEEFLILLTDIDTQKAGKMATSLLQRIVEKPIESPSGEIAVTMSFGVATYDGEESILQLISRADKMLYQAKVQGRNQVCF